MELTFICPFELRFYTNDNSNIFAYYDVTLKVTAEVNYIAGVPSSTTSPGKPSIRTIKILSYKIINVDDGVDIAELDQYLHDNPSPSLDDLYEYVWDEYTIQQELAAEEKEND